MFRCISVIAISWKLVQWVYHLQITVPPTFKLLLSIPCESRIIVYFSDFQSRLMNYLISFKCRIVTAIVAGYLWQANGACHLLVHFATAATVCRCVSWCVSLHLNSMITDQSSFFFLSFLRIKLPWMPVHYKYPNLLQLNQAVNGEAQFLHGEWHHVMLQIGYCWCWHDVGRCYSAAGWPTTAGVHLPAGSWVDRTSCQSAGCCLLPVDLLHAPRWMPANVWFHLLSRKLCHKTCQCQMNIQTPMPSINKCTTGNTWELVAFNWVNQLF